MTDESDELAARKDFPYWLRQLADAAGVDAALTIALERGGSVLEIPHRADGSVIETLVGIAAARTIVHDLAGERIEVPLAKQVLNTWLRRRGLNQVQRARTLRVARSTIKRWDGGNMPAIGERP